MTSIGAFEAKTHFAGLIDRVVNGEQITVTRHGIPVARIVPARGMDRQSTRQVIQKIKELRKGQKLGGLSVRKLIHEGRP